MSALFFVHIPKTAGTSFRAAAIAAWGKRNVVRDYGPDAPETSDVVHRYIYDGQDHWSLYERMRATDTKLLCGHVLAKKYVPGMGVHNTITFFRDPVQRLYSEYQHFVRHRKYKGTFRDFYSQPRIINVQLRHVRDLPLRAMGAIGITERYQESLEIVNHSYRLNFQALVKNNYRELLDCEHEISQEDLEQIQTLHAKDLELYQQACDLFNERWALYERGQPYAHVGLTTASVQKVAGWAWWEGSGSEPVALDIRLNGQVVAQVQAQSFWPNMCKYYPPRGSHIGFSTPIQAKPGDSVDCVVRETGQVIPSTPLVVEDKGAEPKKR
ncbi:sulfotransferase family 2 domain-containing protein [Marinimicrobium sp. C2-29]|uniref:sulfotransferase family 2 domain-containing protein n=1 Tax=Marinimicrobium sp. C2-29 TaxID=3139825 RepID=UPI003139EE4E